MSYERKYIKYKNKYLKLKELLGGGSDTHTVNFGDKKVVIKRDVDTKKDITNVTITCTDTIFIHHTCILRNQQLKINKLTIKFENHTNNVYITSNAFKDIKIDNLNIITSTEIKTKINIMDNAFGNCGLISVLYNNNPVNITNINAFNNNPITNGNPMNNKKSIVKSIFRKITNTKKNR